MGFQDRGGGREGKKTSLRANKQNAAEAAKKAKDKPKADTPMFSPPAPPVVTLNAQGRPITKSPLSVDAVANLVSRQFDRDREAVLRRARDAGVVAIITSSTEVEKQEEILKLAKQFTGQVYCAVGVHPDNVKRTNDKQMAAWIAQMKELALSPEVVAIQTGLNLSRETSTHFAQERLLDMHVRLAAETRLPVILHLAPGSAERAAEIVAAAAAASAPHAPPQVAVANALVAAGEEPESLRPLLEMGAHLLVSGAGVSEPAAAGAAAASAALAAVVASGHGSRLLLSSSSPAHTPQSIPDEYLRTLRNEPSNLPFVVADVAKAAAPAAWGCTEGQPAVEVLAAANAQLWEAGARFFALLTDVQDAAAKTAAAAAAAAAVAAEGAASGSGDAAAAAAVAAAPAAGKPPAGSPAKGGKRPVSAAPPQKGKGAATAARAAAAASDGDSSDGGGGPPQRRAAAPPARKIGGGFAQLAGGSDSEGEEEEGSDEDASSSGRDDAEEEEQQQGKRGEAAQRGKGPRGPAEPARAAAAAGKGGASSFACKMCRSLLWSRADVLQHGWGADRREFSSGGGGGKGAAAASDDNGCLTNVFVSLDCGGGSCEDRLRELGIAPDEASGTGAAWEGKAACVKCGAKLGRFSAAPQPCACGALVEGPVLKVLSARVDLLAAAGATLEEMMEAAKLRGELEDAAGSDDGEEERGGVKATGKARRKMRRDGVGNFSSYRNKDFTKAGKRKGSKAEGGEAVEEGDA